MPIIRRLLALALAAAPSLAAQVTPAPADTGRKPISLDSIVNPAADQARGVDAELRTALFDLVSDKPLSAISRLEWLRGAASAGSQVPPELRAPLLFLLAEAYYRVGMRDAFRTAAQEFIASTGTGRHAGILRSQLLLDAYRRGEYARAIELAASPELLGDRGLASLVSGLAQYHTGNFAAAKESFAAARQVGGSYAPYAHYMETIATLRTDTTQATAALEALRSLAGGNSAGQEFSDQTKVTAAQLAYQAGQYDAAASLAQAVTAAEQAPQALLTRAWSLYRAKQLDAAAAAFRDFATKFPQLPQRDEARLMIGQVMLETGRVDDAEQYFQGIADSLNLESGALQARTLASVGEVARAIVAARAAGVMFLTEPQAGKNLAVADAAGADQAMLLATFSDNAPVAALGPPDMISFGDVEARLNSYASALGDFPRRVLYASFAAEQGGAAGSIAGRTDALFAADVALALARFRLQEQIDAHAARIGTLQALQQLITDATGTMQQLLAQVTGVQDSLKTMASVIDNTRNYVRQLIQQQVEATRALSSENVVAVDSMRASLGASVGTVEASLLSIEQQTAIVYGQMANSIAQGLDAAVARHPLFALQDSLRRRLDAARALYAETEAILSQASALVNAELARLQGSESEGTRAMRASVASAESARAAAESQLVGLLESELRARTNRTLALLRHDTEAAEFGSASAAFFKAIGSTGATTPGGGVESGTSNGAAGTAPGERAGSLASRATNGTPTSPR